MKINIEVEVKKTEDTDRDYLAFHYSTMEEGSSTCAFGARPSQEEAIESALKGAEKLIRDKYEGSTL